MDKSTKDYKQYKNYKHILCMGHGDAGWVLPSK